MSVDPLAKKYPELSPYQFASNTPISAIDIDGLEAYIVVETKGTGHTFIYVANSNTAYTYGRYGSVNWFTGGLVGEGVLVKYSGTAASNFLTYELNKNEARVFKIDDANIAQVSAYFDKQSNSSKTLPDTKNKNYLKYGKVVDTYNVATNNCTTKSCDALKTGGSNVFEVDGVAYDYDEDFVIPSSLVGYLEGKSKDTKSGVTEVTSDFKNKYPVKNKKDAAASSFSTGSSSGLSGDSSGSTTNSSSGTTSSSGNNSGSSSSQDTDVDDIDNK